MGSLLGLPIRRTRDTSLAKLTNAIETNYFLLPTAKSKPLLSPELSRSLEVEIPKTITLQSWTINCFFI